MISRVLAPSAVKLVFAVFALGVLVGCASDPRYSQGTGWVAANEAEKLRLEAAGFPQFNNGF